MGQIGTMLRALYRLFAFDRSPYIANAGDIGIVAVTLVVDYGVHSTSAEGHKFYGGASIGFRPGVTSRWTSVHHRAARTSQRLLRVPVNWDSRPFTITQGARQLARQRWLTLWHGPHAFAPSHHHAQPRRTSSTA